MAEEFDQLDQHDNTPPVVLHLPPEMSRDTHIATDIMLPGDMSTEWSPLVNQSPLMSPSPASLSPYLESSESRESPLPVKSHGVQKLYNGSHDHDEPAARSYHHPISQNDLHNQQQHGNHMMESHDQESYEAYANIDSFSCPNLSTLEAYGERRHLQHFSSGGQSAIWDDRYHDNCASMTNIHVQHQNNRDHHSNNTSTRRASTTQNNLPAVVEESSSPSAKPPSHVYKVVWLLLVLVSILTLI